MSETRGYRVAWFSRITRFGDVHLVYGQEARATCGLASVIMCVFKINKLTPGAETLLVENELVEEYKQVSGNASYDKEKKGTGPQNLVTILNRHTKGNWNWRKVPVDDVAQLLIDKVGVTTGVGPTVNVNPVILGVDWEFKGAHWVVVDTVRSFLDSTYATICDPWDTNVHIQKFAAGEPFVYRAGEGGFKLDFWGTNMGDASPYANTKKGMVKTWGMLYRD